jgi:hypothetical protein
MLHTHSALLRLLTLMIAILCLTGCEKRNQPPTAPSATTAPVTPTISTNPSAPTAPNTSTPPDLPSAPTHFPGHNDLQDYLVSKGAVTIKEAFYTFTMRADNGSILLEYKDDTTSVTVTLRNGTTTHPVSIAFDAYTASAEVDATTYCAAEPSLNNFQCNTPSIAASLKNMATTAVWTCFTQAATAMDPSGVTMASLGFANFEE